MALWLVITLYTGGSAIGLAGLCLLVWLVIPSRPATLADSGIDTPDINLQKVQVDNYASAKDSRIKSVISAIKKEVNKKHKHCTVAYDSVEGQFWVRQEPWPWSSPVTVPIEKTIFTDETYDNYDNKVKGQIKSFQAWFGYAYDYDEDTKTITTNTLTKKNSGNIDEVSPVSFQRLLRSAMGKWKQEAPSDADAWSFLFDSPLPRRYYLSHHWIARKAITYKNEENGNVGVLYVKIRGEEYPLYRSDAQQIGFDHK